MPKFRSALLASLLLVSTALPSATYANVEGTVEAEKNSTVQIPQENTNSTENKVIQEETTATTEAVEEQTDTPPEKPTTSQPETTTPAATEEEPTSVEETTKTDTEKTEQAPIETEQKQPGEQLTVKQKLADVPNSFWAKNEVMQ